MHKLLLIHPKTRAKFVGFGESESLGIYPLSLAYIAALTPAEWEIKIVDEYVTNLDLDEACDLVGITAYTSNATRAYDLAARYKQKGIPVVLGGIHASLIPQEAVKYVDTVVTGEVESVWQQLIEDFQCGKLKKEYHGQPLPLEGMPLPRRDLLAPKYAMDAILTTRGCPFDCSYCCITHMYGKSYRVRPVAEVLDELAQLKKKVVYFIDDNFFGSGVKGRDRALAICQGMIKRRLNKFWATQASLNIAEYPEVLKSAYKSGCRSIYIGLESISPEALKSYNKNVNFTVRVEGMIQAIKIIHKHGISVIGSFIFGGDHDDLATFEQTRRFMNRSRLDVIQMGLLTPYPGTRLHQELLKSGRMVYTDYPDDWDSYDTDHITYKPKILKPIDIIRGFDFITRQKFSRGKIILQALRTLFHTRSLVATIITYGINKDSCDFFNFNKLFQSQVNKRYCIGTDHPVDQI